MKDKYREYLTDTLLSEQVKPETKPTLNKTAQIRELVFLIISVIFCLFFIIIQIFTGYKYNSLFTISIVNY